MTELIKVRSVSHCLKNASDSLFLHSAHFSADASLPPVQMSVELIPYEELKWGRFLGRGAEGAVYAAWYLETPVAVKRPESKVEVEMNLHSGTSCHVMQ